MTQPDEFKVEESASVEVIPDMENAEDAETPHEEDGTPEDFADGDVKVDLPETE